MMGDKIAAKSAMMALGVPLVPGSDGELQDLDTARVNELLAKVNLRIALAELARLEGTSLARYNVQLEE